MSFPRYPQYKESGTAWLGQVPDHWRVSVLKHIVSTPITDGPHETPDFPDEGIPFVSAEAVAKGRIDFTRIRGFISRADHERYCQKYCPRLGDIYMVKSGATTGVTAIVETEAEFNIWSPLAAIRCGEKANPRFVLNFLRSRNFQEGVTLNWSFGTQQNIGMRVIENMSIAVPPLAEQTSIASVLDRETEKIDALVAEQRRLIELLKEKRQAVISHAVTKGLNPHASMKPSGVEWLGDLPEHWDKCLLKRAFKSVDYGISNSLDAEGPIAILRMGNIENGKVVMGELKYANEVDATLLLRSGDLLYNRTNSLDLIGKVGMFEKNLEVPVSFASYLVRLRTVDESLPSFFAYLLNTPGILALARANAFVAIGQCNLNPTRYGQIEVAIPPRVEQAAIVAFLDSETARLDALTAEAERAIDLLHERRTALISAAVTGKIDVRGLAESEAA